MGTGLSDRRWPIFWGFSRLWRGGSRSLTVPGVLIFQASEVSIRSPPPNSPPPLQIRRGEYDQAQQTLQKLIRFEPDDPQAHYLLARTLLRRGKNTTLPLR
jgi:hypothetical protein